MLITGMVLALAAMQASPQEVKRDWSSMAFAPCEGVGIHASARYVMTANISKEKDGSAILTQLVIYGSSAAFDPVATFLSATAVVVKGDTSGTAIKLTRPTAAAVEEKPGLNETVRLYLPEGVSLKLAPGSKVKLTISAMKSGCSLNTSTKIVDLGL